MSYKADNPFEDSSSSSQNPFEEEERKGPALPPKSSSGKNAPPPPAKNNTIRQDQVTVQFTDSSSDSIRKKEQELKRREEELERREQALAQKEKLIEKSGGGKPKNWPRCKPIIYHDIDAEVPREYQKLVKAAYFIWFGTIVCYLYNTVSVLAGLIATGAGSEISGLILSIINIIFFVPLSFLIYRLLYRATRKGKSGLYLGYMVCLWIEFIWYGWNGVGLRGWGGGGLLLAIPAFNARQTAVGVIALVCTILWGLLILLHLYLFIHARINYRLVGGWNAAKKQGASAAVKIAQDNPELVMEGAKMAAKTQV